MNVGQMLVELGYKPRPKRKGFPAPAVILVPGYLPSSFGYAETKDEIQATIDAHKTVGERATGKRSATTRI